MTCHAGVTCETHKATFPKIGEIEKTGPRWLKGGIDYKGCTLLKLGADGETYEPITLADLNSPDVGKIVKAAVGTCDIDLANTPEDQSCSAGVILKGCMLADYVCWPEGYTQEAIDKLVACSNCCLIFQWVANYCPPAPEGTEKTEKVAALPSNAESGVVKPIASKEPAKDTKAKSAKAEKDK